LDREPLVELLVKVGGSDGLMARFAGIEELDLNPVIVGPGGPVAADARVILSEEVRADERGPRAAESDAKIRERFAPLLEPRTVAVVGASSSSTTIANTFIRRLKDFGFSGAIYPIHPKAEAIEGLACYPGLAQTPEPVDYAYVAIGARAIPELLRQSNGRVRFAQVISSGFGEVSEGVALEAQLVAAAREGGCRVVGPNCLGLYSPRGRVTFPVGAPTEAGSVGVITQSGGLGTDIIKRGQWRGLRFRALVTIGNSADLGPADFLEFYLADPATKVIGLYLEDVKDGRRFFDLLRARGAEKPVVILRGGRSAQGRDAAASHTGAMAGDNRAWECLARQAPCAMVATVDEMIDALLAFQHLALKPQRPTSRVVLFGNGGGTSVLATDTFADCGLDVARFDATTLERLEAMKLPPGTSVTNPIDAPVATLQEQGGLVAHRILDIVYDSAPDALVMHLNLAAFVGRGDSDPVDNLMQGAIRAREARKDGPHFLLALRVDGSPELEERRRHYREVALAAGIPVYDELDPAAKALRAVSRIERHRARNLVRRT
jgi:acyl-CoA synthetase (NDP forming)